MASDSETEKRDEKIFDIMRQNKEKLHLGEKWSDERKKFFQRLATQFQVDIRVIYKIFQMFLNYFFSLRQGGGKEKYGNVFDSEDGFYEKLKNSEIYKQVIEETEKSVFRAVFNYLGTAPEEWTQKQLDNFLFERARRNRRNYTPMFVLNKWGKVKKILKDAETGKFIQFEVLPRGGN